METRWRFSETTAAQAEKIQRQAAREEKMPLAKLCEKILHEQHWHPAVYGGGPRGKGYWCRGAAEDFGGVLAKYKMSIGDCQDQGCICNAGSQKIPLAQYWQVRLRKKSKAAPRGRKRTQ